jgi:hypothetical protein
MIQCGLNLRRFNLSLREILSALNLRRINTESMKIQCMYTESQKIQSESQKIQCESKRVYDIKSKKIQCESKKIQ